MRRLFPTNAFVPPKLPDPSKDLVRLVIAEAPGAEEAIAGEPLVGGSGKVFNRLLQKAGIDRDGLTISNCISCQPLHNLFPTDAAARGYINAKDGEAAVTQCLRNHLRPLIDSRKWTRIDLLGDKPLKLVANVDGGISNWRGSPLDVAGHPGLATFHPAYVMRDQVNIPVVVNDLQKSLVEPPEFYIPHPSIEDVRGFKHRIFAFDCEEPKYRIYGNSAPVELVGLCGEANHAICVPTHGEYLVELKRIFRDATEVIGHNCLQYDLPELWEKLNVAISPECKVHDTMLQQHLLCPDFPHDLEFVGSMFVSKPAWKDKRSESGWEVYCCRDTDVTFQSWLKLLPMLREEGLEDLYWDVQVPLAKICKLMTDTGFKVNPNRIKEVRAKLLEEMSREERNLPEFLRTHEEPCRHRQPAPEGHLGKSGKAVKFILVDSHRTVVPWRSTPTKQRYLYSSEADCLGLEPVLDPKTGRVTTGKIAIAKLYHRTHNDSIRALGVLNKLDETITTFAKEEMVKISRMHPHFNVHGTASGRLSSSDPNLQNIPESARVIYVPSHVGWKIVDVDYSQIENRLTAYFAGDRERLERFEKRAGFSEHKYAASLFLDIPYDEVEKDNDKDAPYGKAKRIVHGTNYGMGYKKISALYDMDLADTRRLQDTWKKAIWPTILWQVKTGERAKQEGVLVNPFGRKRWLWTSSYYTEALSFLPQSTAADILFRAMIGLLYTRIGLSEEQAHRVVPCLKPLPQPARLLISVHDSLVFEAPDALVEEVIETVRYVLEQPWPALNGMSIPTSVKTGLSWGECD